jgi:hypothetical protein
MEDCAMDSTQNDPAKWLATIFENSQAMMRQFGQVPGAEPAAEKEAERSRNRNRPIPSRLHRSSSSKCSRTTCGR